MARLLDPPRAVREAPPAESRALFRERWLRLGLVLLLLCATAIAFAVAEHLKLERSPIRGVRVTKLISPVCRCASDRAQIRFRLRKADNVDVRIVDANGRLVRRLATGVRVGTTFSDFEWDGRNDQGSVVPDGSYGVRVYLLGKRKFDLATPIAVDTKPPHVTVISARPRSISPQRGESVTIRYRVSEPAVTMLFANGIRVARVRGTRLAGKIVWRGRVRGQVRQGRQRLEVVSRDLAGNLSRSLPFAVRLR